jgi:uncharacterized membrane protein YedE/YeeE
MSYPATFDRSLAPAHERPSFNTAPAAIAAALIACGAMYLNAAVSGRQALLFLTGAGAGLILYHASFGFTSSWREFLVHGRGAGIRAQMLMLALTCLVFFPVLGAGHVGAQTVRGSVSPVGVSVVVGAFLFGVGMQLGGGCASGTLYTAGGGNTRMLATLAAFIAGSVLGTAHAPWWSAMPAARPMSLVTMLGPYASLAVSLAMFAAVAGLSILIERSRHGSPPRSSDQEGAGGARRLVQGPWPLAAGAIGLALVNIATLLLSGRPWGVTAAFALWGAKAASAAGLNVAAWPYWSAPAQAASLKAGAIFDVTSVMDVGIVLGALAAAASAGRFAPTWRVPARSLAAALIGGLFLGYGARIAYGCNIGAYFSGIASGSLHGWLWMAAAFGGNAAGAHLRPIFGLRR